MAADLIIPGAPNFTWEELVDSPTAERLGIDNRPDCEAEARLIHIVQEVAQPARDALGPIIVTSGHRCAALNRAVGGSKSSAHLHGAALDLVPVRVSAAKLALWLVENLETWDQIINERDKKGREWVHVALWPPGERRNRREIRRHWPGDGKRYPVISCSSIQKCGSAS